MSADEALTKRLENLEQRLSAIEARNLRVELEKSWETSVQRKISILLLTYFVACLLFYSMGAGTPFANALVPTIGFFLSTFSLRMLRERWKKNLLDPSSPAVEEENED